MHAPVAHLKHAAELLQQIAEGLRKLGTGRTLDVIEVEIVTPAGVGYKFGLVSALDVIASDLYWDERGNWSDAKIANVRTI